jgi:hypothetical protein
MLRIALFVSFVLSLASVACGGDDKKPPMTPDTDTPAALADAGSTTPPAK